MTPQVAARRFVAGVLRGTVADFLDLSERDAMAYEQVVAMVGRDFGMPECDLLALEDAVLAAATEPHRVAVATALSKLTDAHAEELTTKQQAAFVIGIEVGRALRLDGGGL